MATWTSFNELFVQVEHRLRPEDDTNSSSYFECPKSDHAKTDLANDLNDSRLRHHSTDGEGSSVSTHFRVRLIVEGWAESKWVQSWFFVIPACPWRQHNICLLAIYACHLGLEAAHQLWGKHSGRRKTLGANSKQELKHTKLRHTVTSRGCHGEHSGRHASSHEHEKYSLLMCEIIVFTHMWNISHKCKSVWKVTWQHLFVVFKGGKFSHCEWSQLVTMQEFLPKAVR